MKKKLISYGICVTIGGLLAVWVMYTEGLFDIVSLPTDLIYMILCDAFFVAGIMLALFGALLWIASTGFFDAIGYTFKIALHNFIPTHKWERKSYYEYKAEKEEHRGDVNVSPVVVGAGYLLIAILFLALWYSAV